MVQNFQLASFGSRVELARAEPAKFWLGSARVTKNGLAPTLTGEFGLKIRLSSKVLERVLTYYGIIKVEWFPN